MKTRRGALSLGGEAITAPFTSPPIRPVVPVFTQASALTFEYLTDGTEAARFVPTWFDLAETPRVTVDIFNWGMSKNGPYREVMIWIDVVHEGRTLRYAPVVYVTNDVALIAGREPLGIPKLIADIEFDPHGTSADALFSARIERPSGVPLAYGVARVVRHLGRIGDTVSYDTTPAVGLRPSAEDGARYAAVVADIAFTAGDLWECEGSIAYTGFSAIDDLHRLPVVEALQTRMITDGRASLGVSGIPNFELSR